MMELWDLYDLNHRIIGEHIRGNEMPDNGYHLVVHVWIRNSAGQYLITQRSATKRTYPLMWECVGGSVLKGEDSLTAALREVREEVGIKLHPQDGKKVLTQTRDFSGGTRVNDINDIYLFSYDGTIPLSEASTDEVAQARWMPREEIISLYQNGKMVSVIKDLSYFIDNNGGYFG
ncbi:MAG: NUDIX domain-containing protein [Ruminiclostridium sp.]|nr:NUDIX domain-containing protein [Ruminiclostridium sp.]